MRVTASPCTAWSQQYLHVFLNEVTVLVPVLNEAKHSFALYTPERTRQRWPVRLAAATEQDMNDWVSDGVR